MKLTEQQRAELREKIKDDVSRVQTHQQSIIGDLKTLRSKKNAKKIEKISVLLIESQFAEWGAKQLLNNLDKSVNSQRVRRPLQRNKKI